MVHIYVCISHCKKMKKAQSITHKIVKVPCVIQYWRFGLFSLLLPLLRYPSLCVHITRNCSLLYSFFFFAQLFFPIPFESYSRLLLFVEILHLTISFSVDFVRSGLFYAYFTFPLSLKKNCTSVCKLFVVLCCSHPIFLTVWCSKNSRSR